MRFGKRLIQLQRFPASGAFNRSRFICGFKGIHGTWRGVGDTT